MRVFEDKAEFLRMGLVIIVALGIATITRSWVAFAITWGIGLWLDTMGRLIIIGAASKREASLTEIVRVRNEQCVRSYQEVLDIRRENYDLKHRAEAAERQVATDAVEIARVRHELFMLSTVPVDKIVTDEKGRAVKLTGAGAFGKRSRR